MFERDQKEKGYLIIQIKAQGRYLLIKISVQNRQTHFLWPHSKDTHTVYPPLSTHPKKKSTHGAVCEAQDMKSSLLVLLNSKAGAYCSDASHSSGSPFDTVSSREIHATTLPLHNTPTASCLTGNLPQPER